MLFFNPGTIIGIGEIVKIKILVVTRYPDGQILTTVSQGIIHRVAENGKHQGVVGKGKHLISADARVCR